MTTIEFNLILPFSHLGCFSSDVKKSGVLFRKQRWPVELCFLLSLCIVVRMHCHTPGSATNLNSIRL